jgi:hypothetical protein
MATPNQRRAREMNFAIFRVKGARVLFEELAGKYNSKEAEEAIIVCNELLRKLRRCKR